MTDPTASDDDWNDLARELGVDKSTPPPLPPPTVNDTPSESTEIQPGADEGTADADFATDLPDSGELEAEPSDSAIDEEFDDAEESPVGEAGAQGDAEHQLATGRKRRRRRRRRRKSGQPAEATQAGTAPVETGEDEAEELTEAEPTEESEFDAMEDMEKELVPLAAEEDTASEALRELIATWNVPSWDDIVSGLYRPER
ncbi:MAG: hypothetical protein L0241_25175 [Planctomycetia bacterium]|nr:hypothetical protein [Planctomycetia bacterium]